MRNCKDVSLYGNLAAQEEKVVSLLTELISERYRAIQRVSSPKSRVEAAKEALEQLKVIQELEEKEEPSSSKKVESRLEDAAMMFPEAWIALNSENTIAHLLDEITSIVYEEDYLQNKENVLNLEWQLEVQKKQMKFQEMVWNEEKNDLFKEIDDLISQIVFLIQNSSEQMGILNSQMKAEATVWNEAKMLLHKQIHELTRERDVLIQSSNEKEEKNFNLEMQMEFAWHPHH